MSKSSELVKNTAIISVGKLGTQIVSFLLLPLYTAHLSTVDYGNFDFISTIATFVVPVLTMLMEESMFRFLIDCKVDDEKKNIISHTLGFCISSTIVFSLIAVSVIHITEYYLGYSILFYCLSTVIICLANALSRGLGKIFIYSLSNFISSLLIIIFNIILILGFDMGFWAMLISYVIANSVAGLGVLLYLGVWKYISIKVISFKQLRKMLQYSIPLVPNTVSWSIINVSDRLVIMGVLGASANGLYSVSYKFPNLINTLYNFFNTAWRESAAKIVNDNVGDEFNKVYDVIRNGLFSITVLLICSIQFIYPVFINNTYQESIVYVPILAISIYYLSLSAFYGAIFTAYKTTKILGVTSFIAAGINLLIDIALVKVIGVYAAAISTLVSSYFLYIYRKYKMKKWFYAFNKMDYFIVIVFIVVVWVFYLNKSVIRWACFFIAIIGCILINTQLIMAGYIFLKAKIIGDNKRIEKK